MKTLALLKNIQKYYCLMIYVFVICLYAVITFSVSFSADIDVTAAYEIVIPALLAASCIMTAVCACSVYTNSFSLAAAENIPRKNSLGCIFISTLIMTAFISGVYMLWLYGAEWYLNNKGMYGTIAYNELAEHSVILNLFFSGSKLMNFLSSAIFYELISLSALLVSIMIKRLGGPVAFILTAVYGIVLLKAFAEIWLNNSEPYMIYRRNIALLLTAAALALFTLAYRRMSVRR